MAVNVTNVEDSKKVRKISLTSIKNSLVRRSTRQSGPRSRVGCCCEDANGESDSGDKELACSNQYAIIAGVSERCKCRPNNGNVSINDRHKPGIFKSLRKKLNFKSSNGPLGLDLPFLCKSKQTIKAQDLPSSSFSIIEDSSEGFNPNKSRLSLGGPLPLPPRLRFVRDPKSRPQTQNLTKSEDTSSNLLNDIPSDGNATTTVCAMIPFDEAPREEVPPSPVRSVTYELLKLANHGWYWGPITRDEAEEKLQELSDGSFLVRDSSADRYLLSVSFRSSGKTFHTRIEHSHGLFSFYTNPKQEGFDSIVELINHSMSYSETAVFCYSRPRAPGYPAFPVRLSKPVSRFTQVRSLQYLCRFVIRQNTRVDNIQKLPLPTTLKGYIQEGHY